MAGQVHTMIERIVAQRAQGNATLAATTRTRLALKGFDSDRFSTTSADDPALVARLREVAAELNVTL
jgi:hypothetical protein